MEGIGGHAMIAVASLSERKLVLNQGRTLKRKKAFVEKAASGAC